MLLWAARPAVRQNIDCLIFQQDSFRRQPPPGELKTQTGQPHMLMCPPGGGGEGESGQDQGC